MVLVEGPEAMRYVEDTDEREGAPSMQLSSMLGKDLPVFLP